MKKSIFAIAIISTSLIATASMAAPRANGQFNVNDRQENQHDRIAQGVKSGELTKAEAHNLRSDQRQINRTEQRMRADGGGLSAREHARLAHMQNVESRQIRAKKHNSRDRD